MAKRPTKGVTKRGASSKARKELPLYPWPLKGPPTEEDLVEVRKKFEGPSPRIARIKIKGFRAFPNEDYTFDLTDQGKNLLLFGENGSGKSSVYRALAGILDEQQSDFKKEQNIFHREYDDYVTVEWTNGTPSFMTWMPDRMYPQLEIMGRIHELARRVTLLSYKDLLKVYLEDESRDRLDLFDLLFATLLRHVEMADGESVFIRFATMKYVAEPQVNKLLRSRDPEEREDGRELRGQLLEDAATFFKELNELLNDTTNGILRRANHFLGLLVPGLSITISLADRPKKFTKVLLRTDVQVNALYLGCSFFGEDIERPGYFLNEARLTAIALALYLAGAERNLPTGTKDNTRTLVLDDVLIGLDMSHRIPVLKLLQDEFADWQILLFTHDRVWYDLTCAYTRDGGKWVYNELIELDAGLGAPQRPYCRQGQDHLDRAKQLLVVDYDYTAAAVHIRAHFEDLIKRKCQDYHLSLQYHENPKDYKADKFWLALKGDQRPMGIAKGAAKKMGAAMIAEVEMIRSNVLNKLSHAGTVNLVKAEVQQALDLMPRLKTVLES